MPNFLSKLAQNVSPYKAGEQPRDKKYVKLNTNENPYAPSPRVQEALSFVPYEDLRLYSDPNNTSLKGALAKKYNLTPENIFVGNGSDEVLAFSFPAFFDADGAGIAFTDITYSFYPVYADFFGIKKVILPLDENFKVLVEKFCELKNSAQGIIIANPNAPTGIALSVFEIEEILKSNGDKIVIIDEAYAAFSGQSAVSLLSKYKNLLVVNTFSKAYGLAGIRCGYALGSPYLIDGLNRIKNSFNSYTVNTVTEKLATAALSDEAYYENATQKVVQVREETAKSLAELGFKVLPSAANFIFVSPPSGSAEGFYKYLREKGILIRFWNAPRISSYARISIGTHEDMLTLLKAAREYLNI